jgi:D-sedoheptulose 7-phosphate isomerase
MIDNWLREYVGRHQQVIQAIDLKAVEEVIALVAGAREAGARIFVCGNGGSAASASHLSVDLGKGASVGRARRFNVVSLNENVAWMTALANDLGYENVFVEQMAAQASPGDLLIAISVSGNSPNVVRAAEYARSHGMVTVGLVGSPGGRLAELADHPVVIGTGHFGHCEDAHMFIAHLIGYAFIDNPGL